MLKKVLSLTLVLALCFSLGSVAAFAAEEKTVGGDSDIVDVIFRVQIPTKLDFSIDAFGRKAESQEQIYTAMDYYIVNRTEVPVKVSYALAADLQSDVKFVAEDAVYQDDDTKTDKDAYFGAIIATAVEDIGFATSGVTATPATTGTYTDGVVLPFAKDADDGNKDKLAFSVALDAATWDDELGTTGTMAADEAGVAGFKFYSKLNTYADWQANDIRITGNVKLIALRESTYEGLTFVSGAHQLIQTIPTPVAAELIAGPGDAASNRLTVSKTTTGEVAVINMGTETFKSASVTISTQTVTPTSATYEVKTDGKLYLKWGAGTSFAGMSVSGGGRADIIVEDEDGNETTFQIFLTLNA